MSDETRRVILDIDPGFDDAYALFILLHAEKLKKVKIEAIIASKGNSTLENTCKNVIRLLETTKRTDIPVYKGIREPIIVPENPHPAIYYGHDGFGDVTFETEPDLSIVQTTLGVLALIEIVTQNPKQITLICLGPLTNIAVAHKISNNFMSNVKEIFIMGGNNTGFGNATSAAEYNFYMDPESIHIILNSAKCPITILPFEPCLTTNIDINWRFNVLGKTDTAHGKLMNRRVEEKMYKDVWTQKKVWLTCDAYLVAAILFPNVIHSSSIHHATIELGGNLTRGQMVLDHLKKKKSNVMVIEKIDVDNFKTVILDVMHNELH